MPIPSALRGSFRRVSAFLALAAAVFLVSPALAGPYLVVDLDSGTVLAENQSFDPWYPASITKLMTVYVTLSAVASGEISGTSGVAMTAEAARQPPSKMGFRPGTVITVDTALKIIMVKSANDVAMALGERVGGGLPGFVERMNRQAAALGMTGTHFANANGLPDPDNYTTARDYALLARALLTRFPAYRDIYRITALSLNGSLIRNHNNLLERYPGADGMKTGFICAAGFNVVASASRDGRHILAVVLGGATAKARDELAARLIEAAFKAPAGSGTPLERLTPRGVVAPAPADIHDLACPVVRKGKKKVQTTERLDDGDIGDAPDSYLLPRFKVMDPVAISLGGASDMPDSPETLAQAAKSAPGPAIVGAAASPAAAPLPPPRPRSFN